jgi:hypothetical protein
MRVLIDQPDGWRMDRDGDWTLVTSPDQQLRVLAAPLATPSGTNPRPIFERDIPLGLRVEYLGYEEKKHTRTGWEVTLTTFRLVDASNEERERRIGAVYRMLMYIGVVVVCAPSAAVLESNSAAITAILASARPHLWSATKPACLAELFMEDP